MYNGMPFTTTEINILSRILVFSPGSVTNIEVYIDEVHAGKAKHAEGPLYVLSWRPEKYSQGLHSIRVVVQVISKFCAFLTMYVAEIILIQSLRNIFTSTFVSHTTEVWSITSWKHPRVKMT